MLKHFRPRVVRQQAICLLLCLSAARAAAQSPNAPDVTTMSLQDLLGVEVVSTASKFPQEVKEAPASITVITADEIRRYGHRTLSDTLRSVRGFYTTYDRNYSYIGVRGFSRPGDYNTRVLLLIDGQRMNDPIYDMAPIGTDFPIDVSLIERVEVIRGPGSSLYGTNAIFAVINVVTRTGARREGLRAETHGGSLGTRGAAVSFGHLFGDGRELLLAGSVNRANGAKRLPYPEFDGESPGSAVAIGLDHDESSTVFGSAAIGRFAFHGGAIGRRKQVPTASFESVFGDDRLETIDNRAYLNTTYEGPVGRGWSATARFAYDYYGYQGFYPIDSGDPEPTLSIDRSQSHTVSSEMTFRRRFGRLHLVTVGGEIRRQLRSHMSAEDASGLLVDVNQPGTILGAYVQDEVRLFPWLLVNGGARIDGYPTFGSRATPRIGAVLLPRQQTAIKVLHGRAFRAPNPYELFYYPPTDEFTLAPEDIRTTEVVWEEYVSNRVRTAVTAFGYRADRIIEQGAFDTPAGPELIFENVDVVEGAGIEAEVEMKLAHGLSWRASHAYVRTRDAFTHTPASNSPKNLSKLSVQIPVAAFFAGVEGQYVGTRLTRSGEPLNGFFIANVTATSPMGHRFDATVGVYNLFDYFYSDPGGEEHRQLSIAQDGRTVLARVAVRF